MDVRLFKRIRSKKFFKKFFKRFLAELLKRRYFASEEFEDVYYRFYDEFYDDISLYYRLEELCSDFQSRLYQIFGVKKRKFVFRVLLTIFVMLIEVGVVIGTLLALRAFMAYFYDLILKFFKRTKGNRRRIREWLENLWLALKRWLEKLFKDYSHLTDLKELLLGLALALSIIVISSRPIRSIADPDMVIENIIYNPPIEVLSANYQVNDAYSQGRIKMDWPKNTFEPAELLESEFSELITLGELNNLSDNLVDVSARSDVSSTSEIKAEIKIFKFFKKKIKLKTV